MEYRKLGSTGVEVSAFCLGTMMFGSRGNPDHAESIRIIHRALDSGINFVDTADVYSQGESEEIVGKALMGRRDEVVLATKMHGPMGEGRNRRGNSRLWMSRAVEESLARLNTDHIDLYQIHRPDSSTALEDTLEGLATLVTQGKIRYAGCSTFPAWQIVESRWHSERHNLDGFRCEQPPYSIFVRHVEQDVLPVCQRYGLGVIVWSPLAGGWLSGKYRAGAEVPSDSRAARFARQPRSRLAERFDMTLPVNLRKLELVDELSVVADKAGLSMVQMANAFTLAHPAVTSSIIGPRTMDQLEGLLADADERLDPATLDAIDEIMPPGTTVNDSDRGWDPPWMEPGARRR
jgi:aryl-alcohol dehydrogenase-like predicted oxidoreductase